MNHDEISAYFENATAGFMQRMEAAISQEQPQINLAFLNPESLRDAIRYAAIPDGDAAEIMSFAESLLLDAPIRRAVWGLHLLMSEANPIPVLEWPPFAGSLNDNERIANLLLAVTSLPRMEALHEERQIPRHIRRDTISDLPLWLNKLHGETGKHGLSRRILDWFTGHLNGRLYRLGRLQFMQSRFNYSCVAFRNREDSTVLSLALGGCTVGPDGFITAHGVKESWTTTFLHEKDFTEGFLIDPSGRITRDRVKLFSREWEMVLKTDSAVLDTHIPEDAPLSVAACRDSFEKAATFFQTYFPEVSYEAFVCSSWFFDPCFLKILKPSSNILAFYKEFYCNPLAGHSICTEETLWRIFGKEKGNLARARKDTSMKEAAFEHVSKGGVFHESGGFILKDDIAVYGSQRYWRRNIATGIHGHC